MRQKVLCLIYSHANGALRPASLSGCHQLDMAGYEATLIDLTETTGFRQLDEHLATGRVAFCFAMQGVGSTLTTRESVSLWTARRIPFIGVHYDSPCYNPFNHVSDSPFVANLYHYESFLDIKQRYLPSAQVSIRVPYSFTGQPPPSPIPFRERPIRVLYLKTGGDVREMATYFDSLPDKIRDGIWDQLGKAARSPNLQLCDLANEVFAAAGMDWHHYQRQFWGVVQSMDVYLRRKRAIDFVNWLKFQEGAVVIGDDWDFIDKEGARAVFRPPLDIAETAPLYHQSQFVANTNPYGRDIVHERVVLGLMYGCCVLNDRNAWWEENFAKTPALINFGWGESLEGQLRRHLDSADADLAAETGPAAASSFVDPHYARHLVNCAEQVRQRVA